MQTLQPAVNHVRRGEYRLPIPGDTAMHRRPLPAEGGAAMRTKLVPPQEAAKAEVIHLVRCVDHGSEGLTAADPRHCPLFDGSYAPSCVSGGGGSLCGYLRGVVKTIRPGLYLMHCCYDPSEGAR